MKSTYVLSPKIYIPSLVLFAIKSPIKIHVEHIGFAL